MPHHHSHRTAAAKPRPPRAAAEIDALLLDDELDDFLDRHVAAIRESHADYRSL